MFSIEPYKILEIDTNQVIPTIFVNVITIFNVNLLVFKIKNAIKTTQPLKNMCKRVIFP